MPKTIISDISTLIILDKIGHLDILQQLYSQLVTTPEIAEEYGKQLPEWIGVASVKDHKYLLLLQMQIGLGEASALALANEFEDVLLLLDDLKVRKLADKHSIKYTGTLGIISKAKREKIIPAVKPDWIGYFKQISELQAT